MRKTAIVLAGLLLGSALVTGCGSKGGSASGSDYCSTLKSEAATIKSFTAAGSTPDFSKFADFLAKAHALAAKAPSDVKDDWTVMLTAMDGLTAALDEAGIKIEDFGSIISSGQLPPGVDPAKLTALTTKIQAIASADVTKAGNAISKQAKDTCKIDLTKVS